MDASAAQPVRLTVREVAVRLRRSCESILRLIAAGHLRAINTGLGAKKPRWIVDLADLEEFERRRANAPAPTKIMPPRQKRAAVPNYLS